MLHWFKRHCSKAAHNAWTLALPKQAPVISFHCHHLIPSLYKCVEPIQLLTVLAHHCTNDISNGNHADHSLIVNHRDVPDTVICQ